MADSSLISKAKSLLGNRRNVLDEAEAAATGNTPTPPATALTPKPAASVVKKQDTETMDEKAARFKFERENPGVPYKKMAHGGFVDRFEDEDYVPAPTIAAMPDNPGLRYMMNGGAVCKPGHRKTKMYARGGKVEGPGGPTDDKVPAMLSHGEYVLPADTVKKLGVRNLDKLVDSTHRMVASARGMANGGIFDEYGPEIISQEPPLVDKAAEVQKSPGWKQQVGKAYKTVADKITSLRASTPAAQAAAAAANVPSAENAYRGPGGNYERFAGQTLRNQPFAAGADRFAAGPQQPLPPFTRAPGTPGFSPEGLRQPNFGERVAGDLRARGFGSPPAGAAEDIARGYSRSGGTLTAAGRIAARAAPAAVAGVEGYQAYKDIANNPEADTSLKVMRGVEAAGRTASVLGGAGAGAAAGSALAGPIGTVAGGLAGGAFGAFAPDLLEKGLRALPIPKNDYVDFSGGALPSTMMRQPGGAAPAAAPAYKPNQTPAQAKDYIATTVNNAQAGQYGDQVSRGMRQAGIDSPLTPGAAAGRVVPNLIGQNADATEFPIGPGQGVLTGTDRDGVRRTIFATPDMANRNVIPGNPNAKAELAALEARQANEGVISDQARQEGVLRDAARQAAYEREVATTGSNAILNRPGARQANANEAAARTDLTNFQNRQNELAKTKLVGDASNRNAELGLRGQLATAASQLEGTKYTADAGARSARANLQVEMAKYIQARRDKNRNEEPEWLKGHATTMQPDPKTGELKPVTDANFINDFKKYVKSKAGDEFLKQYNVEHWDDLDSTDKEGLMDQFKRQKAVTDQAASLAKSGNDVPTGLPSSAKLGTVELTSGFRWQRDPEQTNLGLVEGALRRINPLNSGLPSNHTVTVQFEGMSEPQVYAADQLADKPELRAAIAKRMSPQDRRDFEMLFLHNPDKGLRQ